MFEDVGALFNFLLDGNSIFDLRGEEIGKVSLTGPGNIPITVDTAYVRNVSKYETGILVSDEWIIVERYNTPEEAQEGHKKWVELCKQPSFGLSSIQFPRIIEVS